jgi:hypothetical protein
MQVILNQNPALQSSQKSEAANVKNFRQHLQNRLNKTQKLPEISKDYLSPVTVLEDKSEKCSERGGCKQGLY